MTNIPAELMVLFVSAIPVLEQKAAIPLGFTARMDYWEIYLYSLVGAVLPSPFILLLARKMCSLLKQISITKRMIQWIETRTMKRGKNIVRYELLGLFLFVAIPLPGTGVWTGSLAAALLQMRFKQSLLAITLGAAVCGAIIMLLGHGFVSI